MKGYPAHVGIIMDGNRRFSRRLMKEPWKGHEYGQQKLEDVLKWCEEAGIKELTLYAFSMQNFDRPKKEFDYLMDLFEQAASQLAARSEELSERGIRIRFIGRLEMLPVNVQRAADAVMRLTEENGPYTVNIALAYGGREELLDAIHSIAKKVDQGEIKAEEIDESTVSAHLYLGSEPELIIRTGGERRTSNFLVWQSPYSEWSFVETLWPEFSKEDFFACLNDFAERDRRFGK